MDKKLVEYVMKHGRERSRCAVVDKTGVEFCIGNVVCDGKVYFIVSANGKIVVCMEIDMRKEDEGK